MAEDHLFRRLLRHNVVRNAGFLYLVQFSSYVFPFLTLPYLTRVLSEEKFGLVAYAQSFVWYFMTITEYGFNLTATRSVVAARETPEQLNRVFSSVMAAKGLLTLAGLSIMIVAVLAIPQLRPHLGLFLITFLAVCGNLLFPLWLYMGLEKMRQVAARDFLAKLLSLVAVFALVKGDGDYLLAAAAQSGGLLLAAALGLMQVGSLGVRLVMPTWPEVSEQLKTGWTGFVSISAATAAATTNTVLLGIVSSTVEVAYLAAAWRIVTVGRSLVMPLASAVFPFVSQKASRSEKEVIQFVKQYGMWLSAPFLLGGVVVIVLAPWGVPLFLGAKYANSVLVLQLLAMTVGLYSFQNVYSTYYMLPCSYDKAWMRIILQTVGVNFVALGLGFLWLRGSTAVGLATLTADIFAAFMFWRFFQRRSRALAEEG